MFKLAKLHEGISIEEGDYFTEILRNLVADKEHELEREKQKDPKKAETMKARRYKKDIEQDVWLATICVLLILHFS